MLIEFSITNFRSIQARQTLSMVATPRVKNAKAKFKAPLIGEKFPDLLKAAVIYGPNASGKSNVLKAFSALNRIVLRKPNANDTGLPVAPFRFDQDWVNRPSQFDIHFIQNGMRYQFELHVSSKRIEFERLVTFPLGEEHLVYERKASDSKDLYKFQHQLAEPLVLEAWRKLTPPDVLFLTQAVANSDEAIPVLKNSYDWLNESLFMVLHGMRDMAISTCESLVAAPIPADALARFLREMDIPVTKILSEKPSTGERGLRGFSTLIGLDQVKTKLIHKTNVGEATFDFEDESEGTKNLIGFWFPWVWKSYANPLDARVLIVDELDSSLHPRIVESLVRRHYNSERVSQLIFTSHNTHLMDSKLLRRDQIWLTERNPAGATHLRSIHDFEGREGEDIEKRYYAGRYRSLPIL